MEKALMVLILAITVLVTVTAGAIVMASMISTAHAIGCHHFKNQGADCIDGFLCVHHTGVCRQTGPP